MYFGQIKQEKIVSLLFWLKKSFLHQTKNQHFPKGLVQSFCQRIELSIICVFWANQDRKDRFGLLDKKERPLKQKKEVLNTQKFDIYQRG